MKRSLLILSAIAIFLASCNMSQNKGNTSPSSVTDTTGFAQFQMWKATQMNNQNSTVVTEKRIPVVEKRIYYYPVHKTASGRTRSYNNSGSLSSESNNTAKVVKKKGWSMAAKGTAIGAGGGAILGAIINKRNPLVGGVIGGILGGAAGYGIGHSKDKANGRY